MKTNIFPRTSSEELQDQVTSLTNVINIIETIKVNNTIRKSHLKIAKF